MAERAGNRLRAVVIKENEFRTREGGRHVRRSREEWRDRGGDRVTGQRKVEKEREGPSQGACLSHGPMSTMKSKFLYSRVDDSRCCGDPRRNRADRTHRHGENPMVDPRV